MWSSIEDICNSSLNSLIRKIFVIYFGTESGIAVNVIFFATVLCKKNFSAQILGKRIQECGIYGKKRFEFLRSKFILKLILLKTMDEFHSSISMHQG